MECYIGVNWLMILELLAQLLPQLVDDIFGYFISVLMFYL